MRNTRSNLLMDGLPQLPAVVVWVLWLLSVFLAVMTIFAMREFLVWGMGLTMTEADYTRNYATVDLINMVTQCGTIIMGMLAMAVIIFTGDSVFRDARHPRTVRNLFLVLGAELSIVIPAAVIFWIRF